ncbi:MAG: DUF1559 domain-containing protein [Pirellulales bacterium]|nr:DUF1559 domain-containing protein [Pirellulales bacterium]
MRHILPVHQAWPRRHGHTLIELLTVLIIVGVLIAVVMPAVQRARESARRAQCIHNLGQLAQAVHMYVTDDPYGRFPGYQAFATDGTTKIGWAPQLFNYLGREDLGQDPAQATYVEILVCPSDQGSKDQPRLNYVVNGGRRGTDSAADGIFFDHAKAECIYITKDEFRDGLTNTIMLSENLDATNWNAVTADDQCIFWPLEAGKEINLGNGARPSSHHPNGFVAAFSDGRAQFIDEVTINADPNLHGETEATIYVAWLTPGGSDGEGLDAEDGGSGSDPPDLDADCPCCASAEHDLRFEGGDGGIRDTGFTHRQPNTGADLDDPDLNLVLDSGNLMITSTQANLNGTGNAPMIEAPGLLLQGVRDKDICIEAKFPNIQLGTTLSDMHMIYVASPAGDKYEGGPHFGSGYRGYNSSSTMGGVHAGVFGSAPEPDFEIGDDIIVRMRRVSGQWQFSWKNS